MESTSIDRVQVTGPMQPGYEVILNKEALAFIVDLERRFDAERRRLLALRNERQARLDAGAKPDFLVETKAVRDGTWTLAPLPQDLLGPRREITGPPHPQMGGHPLHSGRSRLLAG